MNNKKFNKKKRKKELNLLLLVKSEIKKGKEVQIHLLVRIHPQKTKNGIKENSIEKEVIVVIMMSILKENCQKNKT